MTRELIIAAYNRDYSWISKLDPEVKVTVYRKGDNPKQKEDEILITPNKGRCVHTFFNHLYNNYDNLADYTFFVQDYPFDHWENLIQVVNENDTEFYKITSQLNIGGYYAFHYNTIIAPCEKGGPMWYLYPSKHHGDGKVLICQSNGAPHDLNPGINLDKHWYNFFESEHPTEYEFIPGGHFIISKDHVRLRSKEFYKKVIDFLVNEDAGPWMIERLECYIFNPKIK